MLEEETIASHRRSHIELNFLITLAYRNGEVLGESTTPVTKLKADIGIFLTFSLTLDGHLILLALGQRNAINQPILKDIPRIHCLWIGDYHRTIFVPLSSNSGRCTCPTIARKCRTIKLIIHLIYLLARIYLDFLIGNQRVEVLVVLLRVPSERMTIDGQTCILGIGNKGTDIVEVHHTLVIHTRSILHRIASSHLIEVATSQAIHDALLIEVGCGERNAQLKVGIALASVFQVLYIFLQRLIVVEIQIVLSVLGHICTEL